MWYYLLWLVITSLMYQLVTATADVVSALPLLRAPTDAVDASGDSRQPMQYLPGHNVVKCEPGCECKRHRKCEPDCECPRHIPHGRLCEPGCQCSRHSTKKCDPDCLCLKHAKREFGVTMCDFCGDEHSQKSYRRTNGEYLRARQRERSEQNYRDKLKSSLQRKMDAATFVASNSMTNII